VRDDPAPNMSPLILRNISELIAVPRGPVEGRSMRGVQRIGRAAVVMEDECIAWFGPESGVNAPAAARTFDAHGGCVVPGLVDCHTHTIFAGTREDEFAARIGGKTYAEIAAAGGGILRTMRAVRESTLDELVATAAPRLCRMLSRGITTIEIKSGYGLTVEDELKMLRAVRRLAETQPAELIATYLAAHAVPPEFNGRADAYLDALLNDAVLGLIRDERLAEFCDVFCETIAFDLAQSRRVLDRAARFGLRAKIHADQITQMGASRMAAELGAVSADHLEHIDDAGIAALKHSGTIPVLLPGCSFFLGVAYPPARKLLDTDLPVAIATDFNPGSSMIESLPLVMTIVCTQMRMTPIETLVAATANAAAAVARQDRLGAVATGAQADLVVLDVPNIESWMYEPGRDAVRTVFKRGRVVFSAP